MTDTQVKYQTLMETIRHNQEMETLGLSEAQTKSRLASVQEQLMPFQIAGSVFKSFADLGSGFAKLFY